MAGAVGSVPLPGVARLGRLLDRRDEDLDLVDPDRTGATGMEVEPKRLGRLAALELAGDLEEVPVVVTAEGVVGSTALACPLPGK